MPFKQIDSKLAKQQRHMAVFTQKQMFELKSLPQVQAKPNDSHIWRGLMKIKEEVLACGSFEIKDGK